MACRSSVSPGPRNIRIDDSHGVRIKRRSKRDARCVSPLLLGARCVRRIRRRSRQLIECSQGDRCLSDGRRSRLVLAVDLRHCRGEVPRLVGGPTRSSVQVVDVSLGVFKVDPAQEAGSLLMLADNQQPMTFTDQRLTRQSGGQQVG